jgi:hypothetical protein
MRQAEHEEKQRHDQQRFPIGATNSVSSLQSMAKQ